jgi:hypothetical protein
MPTQALRAAYTWHINIDITTSDRPISNSTTEDVMSAIDTEIRNATPPIVGVPLFFACHLGPPSYIGCCAFADKKGISRLSMASVARVEMRNIVT